jgi:peroxiredoxin family protein
MPKAGVMSARHTISLLGVFGIALTIASASLASGQDAPVFVGTWTLNIDKTEPAKDKVIEDPESTGAGRTMRTGLGSRTSGGGGSSSGGGTGGGSGSGGGSRGGNVRLIFGGMMMASKTLKVSQADSIVTIEDEDGPVFVNLRADGKTIEETLTNQTVLKTKVQWRKNELVVERSHETDGSARMIMRIDPQNPKLLIVDFHYEHKRQRRTIDQRRVYEAGV